MDTKLVKVELGCGPNKSEGYIGVDRFKLDGVDIIADLNEKLPFDDNSVDVIFASHSLEHVENLQFTMDEIYRICKHGSIVNIIAPYYNQSSNIANIYHKAPFNEHTFRYYTKDKNIPVPNSEYYVIPYIGEQWGLSESDHSEQTSEFKVLHQELLYYPEYELLPEEVKLTLLQSSNNVCFMIEYSLAVWKQKRNITDDEFTNLKINGLSHLQEIVRYQKFKEYWKGLSTNRTSTYAILHKYMDSTNNKLNETNTTLYNSLVDINSKINETNTTLYNSLVDINSKINETNMNNVQIHSVLSNNSNNINNISLVNKRLKKYHILNDIIHHKQAMLNYLSKYHIEFFDGILLHMKKNIYINKFCWSSNIGLDSIELTIEKDATDNNLCLFFTTFEEGSIIIEIIHNNITIHSTPLLIHNIGLHKVDISSYPNNFTIKLHSYDEFLSTKILLIKDFPNIPVYYTY